MFSQPAIKQTRNSLVFLFSRRKITFSSGKQGYDIEISPPPPPKKSNKATKRKAKLLEQTAKRESETRISKRTIVRQKEESAKEKGTHAVRPPKLASKSPFKFDYKDYKNEYNLAVPKKKEQQSIDNNEVKQFKEELELKQRKKEWYEKIKRERQKKLDKINETIKILSLSSNSKEFDINEYIKEKRKAALENYRKRELEKRRERRLNLLTLYYKSSDFVTLNNLDTKIAEMYNEVRQPFTTTLEDMQIDYLEGGGIVDDSELKRRLDRIKDTLNDTAQGGKQKLGLNKIEKLYAMKLELSKSEPNNVQNLVQSLDS